MAVVKAATDGVELHNLDTHGVNVRVFVYQEDALNNVG